jgi:hypothetical protein
LRQRRRFPVPATASPIAIPIGTRVRFTIDQLGASRRDELYVVTGEVYGVGDEGVVAFRHSNTRMCPNWVYVEVASKAAPGEKRYVGVTRHMCEPVGSWL